MEQIRLKEFIDLSALRTGIENGRWKFEGDGGDARVVASLRIELTESLFLVLFVWAFEKAIDLECTEGYDVASLFHVSFKKKTPLKTIKKIAADLVVGLIETGEVKPRAGKDFTIRTTAY